MIYKWVLVTILIYVGLINNGWTQSCETAEHDGSWSLRKPMPVENSEFAVAELNGMIYAAGGFLHHNHQVFLIYNPKKDLWKEGPDLPAGTHHPAVVAANEKIYVIGGEGAENLVQIFDPKTETWTRGKNMPSERIAMAGVEVRGKIHLIGGSPNIRSGTALDTHEIYDPVLDSWQKAPALPLSVEHVPALFLNEKIYVIGGRSDFTNTNAVQIFDPRSGTWTQGAPMQNARSGFGAVVFEKRILVFGGEDLISRTVIASSERYDPANNTWSFLEEAPTTVHGGPAAAFARFIYLFGGSEIAASGTGIDSVQRLSISNRPKSPGDLTAKSVTSNSARLQWSDSSTNEAEFQIQAKSGSKKYQAVATAPADSETVVITGLTRNSEFTFRVRARNGCGTSSFSNTLKITTRP
jgi:N-acetylneuraminic acid mutarotase